MVENDLITKIRKTASKKEALEETDVRTLMILVRKLLDKMPPSDQQSFLIIRLFANWSVHVEITQSNTGLRGSEIANIPPKKRHAWCFPNV